MVLTEDIISILDEIQDGMYKYQKLLKSMRTLYDQNGLDTFFEAFFTPFSNVLLVYKREPPVERVVDFVCKFAVALGTKIENKNGSDEEERSSSCDEEDEPPDFPNLFIVKLAGYHEAKDKAVRFRVCQMINKMLSLAAQENVRIMCIDALQMVMLQRAYDKIPCVRVQAVQALSYFQYPDDKECPAIAALLNIMRGDSSADVRKAALQHISFCDRTLPAIIERVRDVKASVRHAAFVMLSEKCSIMNLTIAQRVYIVEAGLNDRDELVQDTCVSGLLRNWCLYLDSDFMRLLHRLDAENSPEVAELALSKLFDNLDSSEKLVSVLREFMGKERLEQEEEEVAGEDQGAGDSRISSVRESDKGDSDTTGLINTKALKVVRFESLNCEMAFFWSCMCRYFSKKGSEGDIQLEKIVPTLSEFCDYVQKYVVDVFLKQEEMNSKLQSQFVTQQLFSMFEVLDFADEVGRRQLAKLVYDLTTMPDFPPGLVGPLLARQADIWPQESYRIEKLTELIADLRQPPIGEGFNISTDVRHQTLAPDCTQMSESQFINASQLDLRNDSNTLIKCLVIAAEMLRETKMNKLGPTLLTLLDTLVLPCVQNENPFVRDLALNCLGLACIVEVSLAQKHLLLFLQVSQVDHESLQATALKIVFDLLHLFGFEAYEAPEHQTGDPEALVPDDNLFGEGRDSEKPTEEVTSKCDDLETEYHNKTTQKIVSILADFLDGESQLLCSVAAEGLAKLFISSRIMSQKLLARLLLLWYSPECEDDDHLRGVLGVFFPAFAAGKRSHRESLAEILTQVLETVMEAEPSSSHSGINTTNVVDFLLQLTKPLQSEDSVHDSLAVTVANKILADPTNVTISRLYCRALSLMEFTVTNKTGAADLQFLLQQLEQHVTDKISLRYLKKVEVLLQKINPTQAPEASSVVSSLHTERLEPPSEEQENIPVPGEEPQIPTVTKGGKKTQRKTKSKGAPLSLRQEVKAIDVAEPNQELCDPVLDSKVRSRAPKGAASKKNAKTKGKVKSDKSGPGRSNQKHGDVGELELCDDVLDQTLVPTPLTIVRKATKGTRIKGKVSDSRLLSPQSQNPAPNKTKQKSMKQEAQNEDDESDDSLLGEDSPFVKQPSRSRQLAPPPRFECSDQES